MRKYLLAAVAAAAITTPAFARDGSPYVGVDAGPLLVEELQLDVTDAAGTRFNDYATGNHKYGYDVGVNAGYDFGAVRAEVEIAQKRAKHSSYVINGVRSDGDGYSMSRSIMGNLLLDFGDDDGFQGSVGGGLGVARTRIRVESDGFAGRGIRDNGFAWQVLAGVRYPITPNLDLGFKYRFYNQKLDDEVSFAPLTTVSGDVDSRFRSHSLMASLTFNLGAAVPPPPPPPPPVVEAAPPPPPATQTCPDGSVILATDACPVAPPPPPPPPAAPERG
jgi:OmpA-OmpF porin, OOP family